MSRRSLPLFSTKEDQQFKEALKLYESKQYKKSIKILEQNLKKNSSHVESLALKGLVLHYMEDAHGAKQYVEKCLSKGGESNPVLNHIVAIYFRNVGDLANAAKYFKAALDNGSTNKNILRELSVIQAQTRDYKGMVESRLIYLDDQPGYRANWTSTLVAHHLNKDYKAAEKVLARIESLIEGKLNDSDLFEHSECLLYKNQIIFESGDYLKGLKNLEYIESQVFDQQSVLSLKLKYLMNLSREKEASLIYRRLLKINPDNKELYYQLEKSLKINESDLETRVALYDKLATFYPKADPAKFIPLQFLPLESDVLEAKLSDYILGQLKRGVPSTFVNVKSLYKQKAKRFLIEKIVLKFLETEAEQYSPLTWCWTNYFLAQHYLITRDLAKAHQYIDAALKHTPTLVELYIVKLRILKHENKLDLAAEVMDEGRRLDLQDRFINSKTTKYLLRANKVNEAADMISLFTKTDKELVNGIKDLHIIQCCWFIVESAEAYYRLYREETEDLEKRKIYKLLALKRFHLINKIYEEFISDQMDFHTYCMRKGTPRHYLEMLRWADNLYNDVTYNRVLQGLYKIYMVEDGTVGEEPVDKKKKKLSKLELKKRDEFILQVTSYAKDEDPLGLALLDAEPKAEFAKFLTKCTNNFNSTLYLYFKYYLSTEKYILALLQINKLFKKNANDRLVYALLLELKLAPKDDKFVKLVDASIGKSFPDFKDLSDDDFKSKCIEEISKLKSKRDSFVVIEYLNSIDKSTKEINDLKDNLSQSMDPLELKNLEQLVI